MRPGLRLTSSSTIADPGTIVAATTKNAADDGSPGTTSSNASGAPACTCTVVVVDVRQRRVQRRQHPLGVVPARRGLDDLGLARRPAAPRARARSSPGRSRPPELVAHAVQRPAANRQRCQLTIGATVQRCAHRPQRLDHPPHRPAGERRVAGQDRQERPAGDEPAQHAHRRARVAAVDHRLGLSHPVAPRVRSPTPCAPSTVDAHAELLRAPAPCATRPPRRPGSRSGSSPSASAENSSARCEMPLQPGRRRRPRNGRPPRTTSSASRLMAARSATRGSPRRRARLRTPPHPPRPPPSRGHRPRSPSSARSRGRRCSRRAGPRAS